jgi:NADH-quinone oxidoreductase subunit J
MTQTSAYGAPRPIRTVKDPKMPSTTTYLCFGYLAFCFCAALCAVGATYVRKTVHSLVCLIFMFIFSSASLLVLRVEFLALIYVMVYIGAVAVLFIFVIMLLNLREERSLKLEFSFYDLIYLGFVGFLAVLFESVIYPYLLVIQLGLVNSSIDFNYVVLFRVEDINLFTSVFYTEYFFLFLFSGLLLLVSMLCSLTLCLPRPRGPQRQAPRP